MQFTCRGINLRVLDSMHTVHANNLHTGGDKWSGLTFFRTVQLVGRWNKSKRQGGSVICHFSPVERRSGGSYLFGPLGQVEARAHEAGAVELSRWCDLTVQHVNGLDGRVERVRVLRPVARRDMCPRVAVVKKG